MLWFKLTLQTQLRFFCDLLWWVNEKKIEREGNDFDVTLCIQREHKGRGGGCFGFWRNSVYTARGALRWNLIDFFELFIEARCRTKGGGVFNIRVNSINNDGRSIRKIYMKNINQHILFPKFSYQHIVRFISFRRLKQNWFWVHNFFKWRASIYFLMPNERSYKLQLFC